MPPPPLIELIDRPDGQHGLRYNFHAGQKYAWDSRKRIVAIIAGARSGKTSFGPLWLHREMVERGPGDYLVAAPNYPLLDKGAAPEIEALYQRVLHLGTMKRAPLRFDFSDSGCIALWGHIPDRRPRIIFGHADDPDSLEAMTAKAAWLDECGQNKFRVGSYEAVQRRLSVDRGRLLLTTTPYNLGWLKQLVHDPWVAAGRNHPEIDLVRFDSTINPVFPKEELERAEKLMPRWKVDMFFRGIFTRPAGLIYDSFDPEKHKSKRFTIPDNWPRYVGLDFGGVNTAAMFYAEELNHKGQPTNRLFAYREYRGGNITIAEHIEKLMAGEPRVPHCVGGSHSEGQWRAEFSKGGIVRDDRVAGGWRKVNGLPVHSPIIKEVEVGIDRVYAAHRRDEIMVFDDLVGYLEEKMTYSRKVDEAGNPTQEIDEKSTFHLLDAERYIVGHLKKGQVGGGTTQGVGQLKPGIKLGYSPGIGTLGRRIM